MNEKNQSLIRERTLKQRSWPYLNFLIELTILWDVAYESALAPINLLSSVAWPFGVDDMPDVV